jgi:hypothetical protein
MAMRNIQTEITNQLRQVCDDVELLKNGWYIFIYNGEHYIYMPDSKEALIRFSIPHLTLVDNDNEKRIATAINETNREVKFIKVMLLDNGSVSLNYDHKITEGEQINEIVAHIIKALDFASYYIIKKLKTI